MVRRERTESGLLTATQNPAARRGFVFIKIGRLFRPPVDVSETDGEDD